MVRRRLIRKEPNFWDLSWGRSGSFIGIDENTGSEELINIIYVPLGSVAEKKIFNVPKAALLRNIYVNDSRFPGDGLVLLLAGENGESPIIKNFINPNIENIMIEATKQSELNRALIASKGIQEKIASRPVDERLMEMGEHYSGLFAKFRGEPKKKKEEEEGLEQ